MLRMRVAVSGEHAVALGERLERTGGVHRLVRSEAELSAGGTVLSADVDPVVADEVVAALDELGIAVDDYVLVRQEVIAPPTVGRRRHGPQAFAWFELMGEARANARPIARYLALMGVAGAIAALGVLEDNGILIVGAMAVSPDLLPITAISVGIVARRLRLAARALVTLAVGLGVAAFAAALSTFLQDQLDLIPSDFNINVTGVLGGLTTVNDETIAVAFVAGIAGMLALETRASAGVGVAISVTTIPAAAYVGVAAGLQEVDKALGALGVLGANVSMMVVGAVGTLVLQSVLMRRAMARRGSA
jgi:uncharacterized hydrophobic protein (TIGR00271 family)